MPAFQDAASEAGAAIAREPDQVPKNDPHGLAWPRMWHIQQRNL
jgi:hypothetical protein